MDFIIQNIKKNKKYSDNTIKVYKQRINSLYQSLGTDIPINNLKWLLKRQLIKEYLDLYDKLNSKKNYIVIIIILIKLALATKSNEIYLKELNYYESILENIISELNEVDRTQTKTDYQNKNWVSYEELMLVLKEYKKKVLEIIKQENITNIDLDIIKKYTILNLYILDPRDHPPLRADYNDIKIIQEKEFLKLLPLDANNQNWLVIKNKTNMYIVLNKYKTSATYGDKVIKLSKKINRIVNLWLSISKNKEYLFTDRTGKPYTPNGFSKYFTSIFKIPNKIITITLVRHIILSYLLPADNELRNNLASLMCHSRDMQTNYIKK